jgi:hypothetical protein
MYHTTGFSRDGIVDLRAMIYGETVRGRRIWPPVLGLYTSVVVTVTYMRRSRVRAEIAEAFEVSRRVRANGRGAGRPGSVCGGRFAASVLVVGISSGAVLGQALVRCPETFAGLATRRVGCVTLETGRRRLDLAGSG